jgi:excisionase family DNA binding protein
MPNEQSSDSGIPPGAFFTIKEVAAILKVSTRTVKRFIKKGKLPTVRIMSSVRIRRNDFETLQLHAPRSLSILQRLEGKNLGFDPVGVLCGDISEPDPRELLGFLLQKKRLGHILVLVRYLPLSKWIKKKTPISDEDARCWTYLRFAAQEIAKLTPARRDSLRQKGSDPLQVIKLFAQERATAGLPPVGKPGDKRHVGFSFEL